MPLSKARMRERKRLDRLNVKPMSNLNPIRPVKPKLEDLRHLIKSIEGRALVGTPWIDDIAEFVDSAAEIDPYPELDADGQPIPDYT